MKMECTSCSPNKVCTLVTNIPVSPILKNRVRQRLYSLVNNIDGYKPCQAWHIEPDSEFGNSKCLDHHDQKKRYNNVHRLTSSLYKSFEQKSSSCTSSHVGLTSTTKPINNQMYKLDEENLSAKSKENLEMKLGNIFEILSSLRWKIHVLDRETTVKRESNMRKTRESEINSIQPSYTRKANHNTFILNLLEEIENSAARSDHFPFNRPKKGSSENGRDENLSQKLAALELENKSLKVQMLELTSEVDILKKHLMRGTADVVPDMTRRKSFKHKTKNIGVEDGTISTKGYLEFMAAQMIEYEKAVYYLRKKCQQVKKERRVLG